MRADDLVFNDDLPSATLADQVRTGRLQRVAPGIYTSSRRAVVEVVARNWMAIVGHAYPGAVLVDRSAVDARPRDGYLFLDAGPEGRRTPLDLPGLTVVARRGPGPLDRDTPMDHGLWLSSQARALADNTRRTRASGDRPPATLTDDELGDWIDHLAGSFGTDRLGRLRAEAEMLATATGTEGTISRMSALVGAALGTQDVATGPTRVAGRRRGEPVDQERIERFEVLAERLRATAPAPIPPPLGDRGHLLPFYEAYFSNFIEGTELELDDAERVAFDGTVLPDQPEDSHDVAATYELVAGVEERPRVPESADTFVELLEARHSILMGGRPDKRPGRFKTRPNRAGSTVFVAPERVRGTLVAGWRVIDALDHPFDRAVATMFVVAEVHPFDDGNGRMARIMMNAELSAGDHCRIIVPSVYRTEYLASLAALTGNGRPDALVAVLGFAQRWTSQVDWTDQATADADLAATHAMVDPGVAALDGTRLLLPAAVPAHRRGVQDGDA